MKGVWRGPNVPGGSKTGFSTGEGGKGITNPAVQEAYDNVPMHLRSDPRMHGGCAEPDAYSNGANEVGVKTLEELKKLAKDSTFEARRNDKKGKPVLACPSCAHVQRQLGIKDLVECSLK